MKKQVRPSYFLFVVIAATLLLQSCSTNAPISSASVATATPTASSGSSQNNVIVTPDAELVPSAPSVKTIDVCSFFTSLDAQPLVGTAVINTTQGSEDDEITGGTLEYCTYKGDDVALIISLATSSAPNGSQEWQNQLLEMTAASDPDAAITPTSGIGEQSYWVIVPDGSVGLSVAKYPYVFILAVGGNIGAPEDYQDDLITLAQKVLDALP